jgi:fucose 4-O-acetylase-like acetyltransferase
MYKERIEWIDVAKAFAIIFVFIGHWQIPDNRLAIFAYNFHIYLFFILSGFFADKYNELSFKFVIIKLTKSLLVPLVFLGIVNILYFSILSQKNISEIIINFSSLFWNLNDADWRGLWFIPALFSVSIAYYLLFRILKNKLYIIILAYLLLLLQTSFSTTIFGSILLKPFIELMNINNIPYYLFYYSLGCISFPYIKLFFNNIDGGKKSTKYILYLISSILIILNGLILNFKYNFFFVNSDKYQVISKIFANELVYNNYKIFITLVISFTVLIISYILRRSHILNDIGKNTLFLLGMELISKNLLLLQIIPIFNLGIPSINNPWQVIIVSVFCIMFLRIFFNFVNIHIPYLLGKWR